MTCKEKRDAATSIIPVVVPTDGKWSSDYNHFFNTKIQDISTEKRPRIFYFEMIDCDLDVKSVFSTGNYPKFQTEIHTTTLDGTNEFSFEDVGLLKLYILLFALLGSLFCLMI